MKLRMYPYSYNGGPLERDQFALRAERAPGFCPEGITAIEFYCPNGKNKLCRLDLTLGPPEADPNGNRWHWDGNMEAPTLSPSIGCDQRCGWHGHIINGETTNT